MVVTDIKSHGDRGVTTGAGGGYHWQHPATNLHMWRPGRDGRLLADPERQQHPYPTQATEQPFLGTALLSSNEEGERKGSPNTARSFTLILLVSRDHLNIQSCGQKRKPTLNKSSTLRLGAWNVRTLVV